ncbi:MAG TPA: isoamylase early set domain-containing protein [Gemmatimonas sp.]|nr:isoamylase early set domain-containing protein [Gemmatimonas sp.]
MADGTRHPRFVPDNDEDGGDDELLRRVRGALTPLPPANPMAVARVLQAVHGREPSRWERLTRPMIGRKRGWLAVLAGGAMFAAAASIVMLRSNGANDFPTGATMAGPAVASQRSPSPSEPSLSSPSVPSAPSAASLQSVGTSTDAEAVVPVQFVLDLATARSVAVVGDFNDWNATVTPMERLPGSGVWTASLAVRPGRHTYSFVVDGTKWIADPRAPRAADSDFGKPGSVLLAVPR